MRKKKGRPIGTGMVSSATAAGEFLRSRRLELGLSQVKVAGMAGLLHGVYSALEIGKYVPSNPNVRAALAQALRCDPSELRALIPIPKNKEPQTALGKLIHSRRLELGLDTTALAEKAGIDRNRLHTFEYGDRGRIIYATARKLASALMVDVRVFQKFICATGRPEKESSNALGAAIRSRRKELEMSVKDLALLLRVSRQYISQIELGEVHLNADAAFLSRLAGALECEIPSTLIPPVREKKMRSKTRAVIEASPPADANDDLERIKELAGLGADEAAQKAVRLLRRLLERQRQGFTLFFAKDGDPVELELLL